MRVGTHYNFCLLPYPAVDWLARRTPMELSPAPGGPPVHSKMVLVN
jgi:hypothetical protein